MVNWFKFSSPKAFYPIAGKLIPWLGVTAAALSLAGVCEGCFLAPADARQGEG